MSFQMVVGASGLDIATGEWFRHRYLTLFGGKEGLISLAAQGDRKFIRSR